LDTARCGQFSGRSIRSTLRPSRLVSDVGQEPLPRASGSCQSRHGKVCVLSGQDRARLLLEDDKEPGAVATGRQSSRNNGTTSAPGFFLENLWIVHSGGLIWDILSRSMCSLYIMVCCHRGQHKTSGVSPPESRATPRISRAAAIFPTCCRGRWGGQRKKLTCAGSVRDHVHVFGNHAEKR